jgi:hypothetical protein
MITKATKAVFSDENFVWMGNNDISDDIWQCDRQATRLPNSPHGLNDYQHVHNCVVISALNPSPAFYGYLDWRGINSDEVKTAISRSAVYQAFMRCSIRDPKAKEPVGLVVMDLETAGFISDQFPGSSVHLLPGMPSIGQNRAGRPQIHVDERHRVQAHRQQTQDQLMRDLCDLNPSDFGLIELGPNSCNEMPIENYKAFRYENLVPKQPIYGSIYESQPLRLVDGTPAYLDYESADQFISCLRDFFQDFIPNKRDSGLISPSHFVSNPAADTTRGLENIEYVHGIWLDCDGGDMTPDAFARMFPHLRMVQ